MYDMNINNTATLDNSLMLLRIQSLAQFRWDAIVKRDRLLANELASVEDAIYSEYLLDA